MRLEASLIRRRPNLQEMHLFPALIRMIRLIGYLTYESCPLYSECLIPLPPLVICTSPRFIVSTLAIESLWLS